MPNHRATQRKPSALLVEHQLEGQWRPAPASPLPTIQALAASEHSASPFGHSFGELALFPEASTADSAWGGAAPPAPIAVQRLIYKDEKARDEKAPYADITRVPWYEGKKSPEDKALILRAAKTGDAHWTTDEVDAFLKKRESFADYVAYQERLSGHEDLVTHGKVAPTDRLLTPEEFSALPKQGSINPYRLRTAQGGIELRFRDESKGKVKDLAEMLAKDPTYSRTNKIPPVEIGVFNHRVWSFDTRRVVAHQMARAKNAAVLIEYVKISPENLEKRVGSIYTPRQGMGIITAVRYEGRASGSEPWVNPAYADQMEGVSKQWDYSSFDFPADLQEDAGERFGLSGQQHAALRRLRLSLVRISSDNDCLFSSVISGTRWSKSVQTFRTQIADWVRDHRDDLVAHGHLANNRVEQVLADIRRLGSYFNEGGYVAYEAMGAYLQEVGYGLYVIQRDGNVTQVANDATLTPVYLIPTTNPPHSHFHTARPKGR